MAQTLLPTSDVAKSNLSYSSGSAAFSLLNEASPSSSGWIKSATSGEASGSGYATMHITDPERPIKSGDWILKVYLKTVSDYNDGSADIALYQGDTLIASETFSGLNGSFALKTRTLTAGEKANVTDPTNLRVKVTVEHGYVKHGDQNYIYDTYCSWACLETPDKANAGLEMGCPF